MLRRRSAGILVRLRRRQSEGECCYKNIGERLWMLLIAALELCDKLVKHLGFEELAGQTSVPNHQGCSVIAELLQFRNLIRNRAI